MSAFWFWCESGESFSCWYLLLKVPECLSGRLTLLLFTSYVPFSREACSCVVMELVEVIDTGKKAVVEDELCSSS